MDTEHRIKLLKWLDQATPDQLKEFDRKLAEIQSQNITTIEEHNNDTTTEHKHGLQRTLLD